MGHQVGDSLGADDDLLHLAQLVLQRQRCSAEMGQDKCRKTLKKVHDSRFSASRGLRLEPDHLTANSSQRTNLIYLRSE